MRRITFSFLLSIFLIPSIVIAQTRSHHCPEIVTTAIQLTGSMCEGIARNQVCYGHFNLDATSQMDDDQFFFDEVGDIINVNDLSSLEFSPMNEDDGEWGVAMMSLQANLPNTLPGQNVTFILFGDVILKNVTAQNQTEDGEIAPMQAFYLTTGIGDSRCVEAPPSGMLVQTPQGVGAVNFVLNGVEVVIGSTVFFQAEAPNQLIATTLEGAAMLKADDNQYPVLAGTRFGIQALPDGSSSIPLYNSPQAYSLSEMSTLPLGLLSHEINIHQPFDAYTLELLRAKIANGDALCGDFPFVQCESLPPALGGIQCVFPEAYENNTVPQILAENPICQASAFWTIDMLVVIPPRNNGNNNNGNANVNAPPNNNNNGNVNVNVPPDNNGNVNVNVPPDNNGNRNNNNCNGNGNGNNGNGNGNGNNGNGNGNGNNGNGNNGNGNGNGNNCNSNNNNGNGNNNNGNGNNNNDDYDDD